VDTFQFNKYSRNTDGNLPGALKKVGETTNFSDRTANSDLIARLVSDNSKNYDGSWTEWGQEENTN
jgi:hypothetical protein